MARGDAGRDRQLGPGAPAGRDVRPDLGAATVAQRDVGGAPPRRTQAVSRTGRWSGREHLIGLDAVRRGRPVRQLGAAAAPTGLALGRAGGTGLRPAGRALPDAGLETGVGDGAGRDRRWRQRHRGGGQGGDRRGRGEQDRCSGTHGLTPSVGDAGGLPHRCRASSCHPMALLVLMLFPTSTFTQGPQRGARKVSRDGSAMHQSNMVRLSLGLPSPGAHPTPRIHSGDQSMNPAPRPSGTRAITSRTASK